MVKNDIKNKENIKKKWFKNQRYFHLQLGFTQSLHLPYLIIHLIILGLIILYWYNIDTIISYLCFLGLPNIFIPFYTVILMVLGVLLPALFVFALIDKVGTLTSKDDEEKAAAGFTETQLSKGAPILVSKKVKKGEITRVFYTSIPLYVWEERERDILFQFGEHLLGKFHYDPKNQGQRVEMCSSKGLHSIDRGSIDEEL